MLTTTFFEEFCSRLNLDWSDISNNDLFTETELVRWLTMAKDEAVACRPWPFTEGKESITSVSGQEEYNYPTNLKTESIRYLTVNSKRYQKLTFEDYMTYREDYASDTDKYFTDRNRTLYVNYLVSGFSGSIICYGQVEVAGSITSASTTTVFSVAEPEGDEAIIKLAYSKALGSEKIKNLTKSRQEKIEAFEILDGIWNRIKERRASYHTKNKPLFKHFDVLDGDFEGEDPLQF